MNTKSSNWTGRAHRSLDSAFGPHTSHHIEAPDDYPPMPAADVVVVATCAIAALVLTVMALMGWLV